MPARWPTALSAALRFVLVTMALVLWAMPAAAQTGIGAPGVPGAAQPDVSEIDSLAGVDRLLAGLTDADIRALLREELMKDLETRAVTDEQPMLIERLAARVEEMLARISTRIERWQVRLANIDERLPKVRERLAEASGGVGGMLGAAAMVLAAGLAAALAIGWVTRNWRNRLARPDHAPSYLERVLRSFALGLLDFAAVVGFVFATQLAAAAVPGLLGPLNNYVWIYHAGVSAGWTMIVLSRSIFAIRSPAIRITPLPVAAAAELHRSVRMTAMIGMAGWLTAGLSPTLGFGFPPAIVLVALTGTLIGGVLLVRVALGWSAIRATFAEVLGHGRPLSTMGEVLAQAAPVLLAAYIVGAWAYWAGHWLERGQHELYGPVGTLFILLVLPALDAAGHELAGALTGSSPRGQRYCRVIHGTWRTVLGLAAVVVVLRFWDLPVTDTGMGLGTDPLLLGVFRVALALIFARLAWQLIDATFHEEPPAASADPEGEGPGAAEITRLSTLVPLLRVVLLVVIATITIMVVLSSVGVDIGPLLASAGIIGLALGFGAQTLVRDIFSGAFFLIDDAFRIGEYIEIDADTRGEVEAISIRSIRLRHHRGQVITVPFGELTKIINHNRDWVIYKMSFRMEPDTDPQAVKRIVKEVGKAFLAHPEHGPKFLEPLKSQGVLMVDDDSALVMRVKFKCRPRAQFVLRREIYHALQKAFRDNDITLARRKVEVVSSSGGGGAVEAAAAEIEEQAAEMGGAAPVR